VTSDVSKGVVDFGLAAWVNSNSFVPYRFTKTSPKRVPFVAEKSDTMVELQQKMAVLPWVIAPTVQPGSAQFRQVITHFLRAG
jgi:hypothetical protein